MTEAPFIRTVELTLPDGITWSLEELSTWAREQGIDPSYLRIYAYISTHEGYNGDYDEENVEIQAEIPMTEAEVKIERERREKREIERAETEERMRKQEAA